MIFFSERRLRDATNEYIEHYHTERAHQGLGNCHIEPSSVGEGAVVCDERLGGLLKSYRRAA
ncbi:MAG: putative transposase [Chlamydiales bacterium]|jgi:putative transposase